MAKGKFGLSLSAIAVIAFGFAALGQPQSVLLVTGFALLAERDAWLNRQTMQALLLTIAYYLADLVTGWVFGGLARILGWARLYGAAGALETVSSVVGDALYIVLIALAALAALQVLRGKDAGLPFLSRMAGGDFAAALAPASSAPSAPAAPPATAPQPAPAAPVAPEAPPSDPAPAEPEAIAGRFCPACGSAIPGDSRFCTECGAKAE